VNEIIAILQKAMQSASNDCDKYQDRHDEEGEEVRFQAHTLLVTAERAMEMAKQLEGALCEIEMLQANVAEAKLAEGGVE